MLTWPGTLLQVLYDGTASAVSRAWRKGLDLLGLQQDATKGGRMAKPELNSMQAAALVQLNMHTGGSRAYWMQYSVICCGTT
jgi:hypothetical protein